MPFCPHSVRFLPFKGSDTWVSASTMSFLPFQSREIAGVPLPPPASDLRDLKPPLLLLACYVLSQDSPSSGCRSISPRPSSTRVRTTEHSKIRTVAAARPPQDRWFEPPPQPAIRSQLQGRLRRARALRVLPLPPLAVLAVGAGSLDVLDKMRQ